jgi:hypothetical protein
MVLPGSNSRERLGHAPVCALGAMHGGALLQDPDRAVVARRTRLTKKAAGRQSVAGSEGSAQEGSRRRARTAGDAR